QDKLGKRIAEALRLELDILVEREHLDAEAVEAYLRGRQAHLRWQTHGGNGAVAHYQAALALAPNFKPALAHLAMATLLAWFQPRHEDGRDWARESAQAVAAARARAPELPETQLAIANLAAQQGDFREAMRGVIEALRLAPTFALAHEFIGRLLLEIGREREAQRHLELAMELDPALIYGHADIARVRALHGDLDGFHRHMAVLLRLRDEHVPSLGMNHLRVGAWIRDEAMVRRALDMLDEDNPRMAALRTYGELLLSAGEEPARSLALFHRLAANSSPRLQTLVVQLRAERAAYHGRYETALQLLQRAGELVLVDLVWLERCPLFAEIRGEPAYREVLTVVRSRRDQIEAALAAL
ncbi:MAG: hypothetical protein KC431_19385, partial [Myxococcales bacterium]|nr:hypothetical protein [Myxococcales bacterium]